MKLKALLDNDDAVSPVIGVILMVAITVILAAVIATFVLGLGDNLSNTSPQATFSTDFDSDANNSLAITHDSGQSISADQLTIRGGGSHDEYTWAEIADDQSGEIEMVSAGDSINVDAGEDDTIRLIWEGDDDTTATLLTWPRN